MSDLKLKIIHPGPADLGEGPMWHTKEQALYWIDIAARKIHRLDWQSKQHQAWQTPDLIGALVICESGGLMVCVGNEVMHFDASTAKFNPICEIFPKNRTDLRPNDGKCDAAGRFWIGVANVDMENPQGGLFCLDKGKLTQHEKGITISNGLGWSPDNKSFYYTDSLKRVIYAYNFDLANGEISNRRSFVQLENTEMVPDGLAVDSGGHVWSANWNGSQVIRYSPQGEINKKIEMPTLRPTSCAFGGADLKTLFITSASKDVGETKSLPEPAGAVFAIQVEVAGLPESGYRS